MQRLFFVMVSLMGGAETKGGAIRCGGEDGWLSAACMACELGGDEGRSLDFDIESLASL